MSCKKIKQLKNEIRKLEESLVNEVIKTFPIGSAVTFQKWGGNTTATVLKHDYYRPQIFVESHTGAKYWIDYFWLLENK